jgi:diguanylate cyclase (GGDEF)-like protein
MQGDTPSYTRRQVIINTVANIIIFAITALTLRHLRGGYNVDWVRFAIIAPLIFVTYRFSTRLKAISGRTVVIDWGDALFIYTLFAVNPFTAFLVLLVSSLLDDLTTNTKAFTNYIVNTGSMCIYWLFPYHVAHLPVSHIGPREVLVVGASFAGVLLSSVFYFSFTFDRIQTSPLVIFSIAAQGMTGIIFGSLAANIEPVSKIGFIFVALTYIQIIFVFTRYARWQAEREKYKIFEQFFDFSDNNVSIEEVEEQLLQLTSTLTRRENARCEMRPPNDDEIGAVISTPHSPDRWIILDKELHAGTVLESDRKILDEIAKVGSRIIDQVAMRNQLENAARIDPLTGLANRRMFENVLSRDLAAIERHEETGPLSLLFIDIDKFKPVNDIYGHDVGDRLLQVISRRLMKTVRDEDFVSRLGGDEFVVICRGIEERQAFSLSERIVEILSQPYILRRDDSTVTLEIGASIGVASAPRNGLTMHELIVASDRAMYEAKKSDGTSAVCAA